MELKEMPHKLFCFLNIWMERDVDEQRDEGNPGDRLENNVQRKPKRDIQVKILQHMLIAI